MVKSKWKRMNESKKSWFDEAIIEKFRKDNANRDDWAKNELSLNFTRFISRWEKLPSNVKDTYNDDLRNYA